MLEAAAHAGAMAVMPSSTRYLDCCGMLGKPLFMVTMEPCSHVTATIRANKDCKRDAMASLTPLLAPAAANKTILDFYNDGRTKELYKQHIKTILTRSNTYSKKLYKDDDTIMGWGMLNEPRCPGQRPSPAC